MVLAAVMFGFLVAATSGCTTTTTTNVDCEPITTANIGNGRSFDVGYTGTAVFEWFDDQIAATAKWGHMSDW
jgi:hypothetical protein